MKLLNHVKLLKLVYASFGSPSCWKLMEPLVPKILPNNYAALPQPRNPVAPPSANSESLVPPYNHQPSDTASTMLDYVWFKFVRLMYWFADWLLRGVFRYAIQ